MDWNPVQGAFLACIQCSWYRLWIHGDPDLDKVLTDNDDKWIIASLCCIFLTLTCMWCNISSSNSETVSFYQHLPAGKDCLCLSAQALFWQLVAALENAHIWAFKVHASFLSFFFFWKGSLKGTMLVEKGYQSAIALKTYSASSAQLSSGWQCLYSMTPLTHMLLCVH